ncbi:hypothetical protein [Chryseobacterium sp. M5A1_1a]
MSADRNIQWVMVMEADKDYKAINLLFIAIGSTFSGFFVVLSFHHTTNKKPANKLTGSYIV